MEHQQEPDSSDEDCHSADYVLSHIKSGLEKSINSLPSTMSYRSAGSCPIQVDPSIWVREHGDIDLPLSEKDAVLLETVGNLAPNEKKHTVVDATVSKTRELAVHLFQLNNPEWERAVEAVVHQVATKLELPGGATGTKAVLYKMLIYGKGAMFRDYCNSRKELGMCGTLLISLPSKHEGGDFHVTHGEDETALVTAESSESTYTYLSWYGDVKHEITEVTSGHRLVLIYNLVNVGPEKPAKVPRAFKDKVEELKQALLFWKEKYKEDASKCPGVLAYIFGNRYPEQSLSYYRLKGDDRRRAECLVALCKAHGFTFYLATLRTQSAGESDDGNSTPGSANSNWVKEDPDFHFITDETEDPLELRHIVERDGTKLSGRVPFSKLQIVQDGPFVGNTSYEETSSPTENAGGNTANLYPRSVAVLMPTEYQINFLFESHKWSPTDMYTWVDELIERYESSANRASAKEDLVRACALITEDRLGWLARNPWGARTYYCLEESSHFCTDELLGNILRGSLHLNDAWICQDALRAVVEDLPQPMTAKAIQNFGFSQLKSELDTTISRFDIAKGLRALISLIDEYRNLDGHDSYTLIHIITWVKDQTQKLLTDKQFLCAPEGQLVAKLGFRCGEDYFIGQLVPLVKLQIRKAENKYREISSAVLEFLFASAKGRTSGELSLGSVQDLFRAILEDFIPSMKLTGPSTAGRRERISEVEYPYVYLNSKKIMQVLLQCVSLGLGAQAEQLLDKLGRLATEERPAEIFTGFFLPLAKELHEMSNDSSPSVKGQEIQSTARLLVERLLELYPNRCVGPKPLGWQCAACGCGCTDCLQLDNFLLDPVQQRLEISLSSESRVVHLKEQLPRISQDQVADTYERHWGQPFRRAATHKAYEHETELKRTSSGFTLSIRKTQSASICARKQWIHDRKYAEELFNSIFDDESLKKNLGKVLGDLGREDVMERII